MTHNTEPTGPGYSPSRRKFLEAINIALMGAVATVIAIPFVGFLLAPLFAANGKTWRAVGKVSSFKVGQTVEVAFTDSSPLPWAGVTGRSAAWLRRDSETRFIALSVNCTHLGCPVMWLPDATLFMCPCHGGVYYEDGTNAAGPPPRPLRKYPVRVVHGQVEVLAGPAEIV